MKLNKIFSFLVLSFLMSCINDDVESGTLEKEIGANDQVPSFIVYSSDNKSGERFNSENFKNKISILMFFHTDCKDCQRELPKIQQVWNNLEKEDNYQIVTIARDQNKSETDQFWKDNHFTMPKYIDPDREVYYLFANSYVPRIYLINQNGIVVWMAVEEMELTTEQLIQKMKELQEE